jgi:hypothetical protein
MIFVFNEDATLDVIADSEEAVRRYEGVDVEDGVYKFFDGTGARLSPHFIKQNKRSKFTVESGEFVLLPSSRPSEEDIFSHLNEVRELNLNRWFDDLEEVKRFLNKQRRS